MVFIAFVYKCHLFFSLSPSNGTPHNYAHTTFQFSLYIIINDSLQRLYYFCTTFHPCIFDIRVYYEIG